MRFLADENIHNSLIAAIRRKGYSVKDIKEEKLQGIDDQKLAALANKEKRILITFDKDFLNTQRFPKEKHCGIVVLRYTDKSPNSVVLAFSYLLDSPIRSKFEDHICEIFDSYVKILGE